MPLLNDGSGLDNSLKVTKTLSNLVAPKKYEDFTVDDPTRNMKVEVFEKREKERMSKEREAITMQQKKKR